MNLSEAKHAFITGGASGIGLGIATALASRGIAVTLADVDREALEAVVGKSHARLRAHVLDTRDRPGWILAKAEAERAFGPVDILVNNAGIAPDMRPLADMTADSFDRIVAINLTGVFNGISAFAADLRARRRGHIVNTASMAGLTAAGFANIGGYAAAKYAVVGLSEVLRTEMAPHDIGVSVLCPGMVPTNLWQTTKKLAADFAGPAGDEVRGAKALQTLTLVSAEEVGEKVAQGISANLAYIVTHPGEWPNVERRFHKLEAAFGSS